MRKVTDGKEYFLITKMLEGKLTREELKRATDFMEAICLQNQHLREILDSMKSVYENQLKRVEHI